MIYPVPQKVSLLSADYKIPDRPVFEISGDAVSFVEKWCSIFNQSYASSGNVKIFCKKMTSDKMIKVEETLTFTDEKYIINTSFKSDFPCFEIIYAYEHGLWHALCSIDKIIKSGVCNIGSIEDYPLFSKRGFIEGFYGKPWDSDGRFEIMKLMSYFHMNTYYYAPKDDEYHRAKWDELYDEASLAELRQVVKNAENLHLELHYCIAPGLTMEYTNAEQFELLFNKLRQIYDIGVKNFGLLLDDISDEFQFESDKKAFDEIEDAHIYVTNKLYSRLKALDKNIKITYCPLVYHGNGTEHYVSKVGRGLPSDIDLFWTGHNICSQELTVNEAITFMNSTYHKPLYWDNFPVNDAEMFNEMHIGPIIGREPLLYRYSAGLIANCMEYVQCNKFSLITIADYLWNPHAYSADESWKNSIETVLGKNSYDKFVFLADNLRTSCLKDANSSLMSEYLYKTAFNMRFDNKDAAAEVLSDYISKMDSSISVIKDENSLSIMNELSYWLEKFELCCDLLRACLKHISSPDNETKTDVIQKCKTYNFHPARLADFCLQEFVDFIV